MRNLIEKQESAIVVCDNPECNFEISQGDKPLVYFVNKACPICRENLLTEKDYNDYMGLNAAVDFINKWFSWITIFMRNKKFSTTSVHVHKGIKFTNK
jgi:hypothetical protein